MDRSVGSPRIRSVVGVRGPGVIVFGLPNLPCVYILFSLISIARSAFKFPRICFRRTNCEIYQEPVCLLAFEFYIATPGPAVITVCKYSKLILIADNIFAFRTFFFGRNALRNTLCIC